MGNTADGAEALKQSPDFCNQEEVKMAQNYLTCHKYRLTLAT